MFRKPDNLFYRRYCADFIYIFFSRILRLYGFLGSKKYFLFFSHSLLHSGNGAFAAYIKMHYHFRKNRHPPECHHRHAFSLVVQFCFLLNLKRRVQISTAPASFSRNAITFPLRRDIRFPDSCTPAIRPVFFYALSDVRKDLRSSPSRR